MHSGEESQEGELQVWVTNRLRKGHGNRRRVLTKSALQRSLSSLTTIRSRGSEPVTWGRLLGELAIPVSSWANGLGPAGSTGEVTFPEQMQRMGREGAGGWNPRGAHSSYSTGGRREARRITRREQSPKFLRQRLQGGQTDEDSDLTLLLAFRRALVTLGRCDAEVETRFATV